jgi:hypothetical protein
LIFQEKYSISHTIQVNHNELLTKVTRTHKGDKMGPKRKLEDHDGQEPVHASRRLQVYGHNQKAAKKPRQKPSKPLDQLHPSSVYRHQAASVNAIKKRIRDVTRKLEHSENLPANIRMEDERALAAYQQELTAAEAEKARQKMISRYHMVRFFGMLDTTSMICLHR